MVGQKSQSIYVVIEKKDGPGEKRQPWNNVIFM